MDLRHPCGHIGHCVRCDFPQLATFFAPFDTQRIRVTVEMHNLSGSVGAVRAGPLASSTTWRNERLMRVLLADDQLVTLEGVRIVLESSDDISVVGQAGTPEELSSMVARTRPDVVLIDPQLCGDDDFGCIDVIRTQHREAKVVFFSMKSNIHHVQAALEAEGAAHTFNDTLPPALHRAPPPTPPPT